MRLSLIEAKIAWFVPKPPFKSVVFNSHTGQKTDSSESCPYLPINYSLVLRKSYFYTTNPLNPPSIVRSVPVIYLDLSDAKNKT